METVFHFTETAFLNVLNMSAAGGVVIGAVLLLRLFLRRLPRKWPYLLWTAAAFRLACPVSVKSAFSLFTPVSRAFPVYGEQRIAANPGQVSTLDFFPALTAPAAGDRMAVPALAPPVPTAEAPDLLRLAALLWMAGMAALLIYGCFALWRTQRLYIRELSLATGWTMYEVDFLPPFLMEMGVFLPAVPASSLYQLSPALISTPLILSMMSPSFISGSVRLRTPPGRTSLILRPLPL